MDGYANTKLHQMSGLLTQPNVLFHQQNKKNGEIAVPVYTIFNKTKHYCVLQKRDRRIYL